MSGTKEGAGSRPASSTASTNARLSTALSRGVTVFGEHDSDAYDRTSGKKWASCPAALWDSTARPKQNDDGYRPKLRFGTSTRLSTAFERKYHGDCYAVAYVVLNPSGTVVLHPPRLNKAELPVLQARGYRLLFVTRWADIDEPKGVDHLTDERWALYEEVLRSLDCAYYRTRGGARIVQAFTKPLGPDEYEVSIERWLPELRKAFCQVPSAVIDDSCSDWTRFMRLPRCLREDDAEITNTWHTTVYTARLSCFDPGDCAPSPQPPPPPKLWVAPTRFTASTGTTRYGRPILARFVTELRDAPEGKGNHTLVKAAFTVGRWVGGGEIDFQEALDELQSALDHWTECPKNYRRILEQRLRMGMEHPRSAPPRILERDALRARARAALEAALADGNEHISL